MAMQAIGGGMRGARGGAIAEINVTPLVDVMLVLLVIFMVAAPIVDATERARRANLILPVTRENPNVVDLAGRLVVEIDADLRVFIGDYLLADCSAALAVQTPDAYRPCLDAIQTGLQLNPRLNTDEALYLLADAGIPYGFVVGTMHRIREAGVINVGMVTLPEYLTDEQRTALEAGAPPPETE